MSDKEFLTAAEAAERLRITTRTLLKWAREGSIESVRVSKKKILFTEDAIGTFVKGKTNIVESPSQRAESSVKHVHRGRSMKGGGAGSSRKSWRSLRKEVTTWQ